MSSRRTTVGITLLALLLVADVVDYQGSLDGLVLLGVLALGAVIGYRVGTVLKGGLYGALAGVGLALVVAVIGAVVLVAVLVLTIPQHRGWGFLSSGFGPAMLFSPLGLLVGGIYFGGAALLGGFGGIVGATAARGRTLSAAARERL